MDDAQPTALDDAVHLVLSRLLGTQSGSRMYNRRICQLAGAVAGFEPVSAPMGHRVLRRRSMTAGDLDDLWAVARRNGQRLERGIVEDFFPLPAWLAVGHVIRLGPMQAWQQSEHLLACWARGLQGDGSKRRQQLSSGTIESYIGGFYRLAKELCELRKLADAGVIDLDPALLSAWQVNAIPARITAEQLGARPANRDRRAPSLSAARQALKAIQRDIENRRTDRHARKNM